MNTKETIFLKLEDFIRKFYTNELLRGTIFFVGLGLFYFLATSFIEYFLWLKPSGRTFLFWMFVLVELFLLGRFIIFPILKLFKLHKGIDYTEASKIIGNHFSSVNDKLINFLQLSNDANQSELLLASIEQKANSLQPIPFTNAIDFKKNKKYLPLAIIPLLIIAFLLISGRQNFITDSMARVIHYQNQYIPPAPFSFNVSGNLITEQNKDYTLRITTVGNIVPDKAMIFINDESYFMKSIQPGVFQYVFEKPVADIPFHIEANDVVSVDYNLKVKTVPSIANFEMVLNFPNYLKKKPEVIKGTGNAIVPEGTHITWKISTVATDFVNMFDGKQQFSFKNEQSTFLLSKNVFQNSEYQIVTSNKSVKNYEKLSYAINVVKDQYPSIKVEIAPDSLKSKINYVLGQISDDYGLSKLNIVYYPKENLSATKRGTIVINKDIYDQFVFAFPSNLPIEEGVNYEYYFEVFDNDVIHNYKSSKSIVFSHRESTESEKQDQYLENQNQSIHGLEKALKAQDKQLNELEKLQNANKEKKELDYKDQQKINDFIKRQKQQEEMMKEFSEKMKENLEKFNPNEKDPDKELLKERLEKVDKDSEKNQKLLDELKQLNNKLEQEDLLDKIEKFQQKSKNQTKSLEQLVELTKRYYVEKKAEKIAEKLNELAEKQEKLSDEKSGNLEEQQNKINNEFDKIQKDLEDLQKENKELKSPLDLPNDKEKQQSIDNDLKNALDELKKNAPAKASPKQKNAAKKMQQMGQSMEMEMQGGEQEQMEEDVKMLRQILDNLLEFSFSQEKLMNNFKASKGNSSFTKYLKEQQDLKFQFKHVDDSLFAMSLRNPKIGEKITTEIGNVYYNIEKSIDYFTEYQVGRGTASQQYSLTSANTLANLLADALNNMQMSMAGSGQGSPKHGKGQGSGMQLPDIIKKQEGLGKKMQEGQKEGGDQPGAKPGEKSGGKQNGQQGGQQGGQGRNGKGNEGESNDGEGDAKAVLDILKEQKQLREALENELKKHGLSGSGQAALDKMKQIERQLINKGFTQDVIQKALNLKYELLKLEQAVQEQKHDNRREATTNRKEFNNIAPALPLKLQEYLKSIEILNRQTLPLRSQFNKRVQEYFKDND